MFKVVMMLVVTVMQIGTARCQAPQIVSQEPQKNSEQFCDIYVIRHGETDWNVLKKSQGHTDIPLNEKGEQQAMQLKEKLDSIIFSAVISSDLARARRTAEIICGSKKLQIVQTTDLRERFGGRWEGRLQSDINQWVKEKKYSLHTLSKNEYLALKIDDCVESYAEAFERVKRCVKAHAMQHLGSTILFSAHGGILRSILYSLDFRPGLFWRVSNCAFVVVRVYANGEISLMSCNGATPAQDVEIPF